jgi:hypothetical protein
VRERRCAYRGLAGKPDGKRQLGRPRRRWGVILKWVFWEYDGVMYWIYLSGGIM